MKTYQDILYDVYCKGIYREGRNGPTRSLFGLQAIYNDVGSRFPIITTRKINFEAMRGELLAFIRGYDDVKDFAKLGCNFWKFNSESEYWKDKAKFPGDLGRIYGVQWRYWKTRYGAIDQLAKTIENLKTDPFSRRHIITAWNPAELDDMCLEPCHIMFQFLAYETAPGIQELDLILYQRSCDLFIGVPYNISSYSLLLILVANQTGMRPSRFIHFMGDAHIYHEHLDQTLKLLNRSPYPLPTISINQDVECIDDYQPNDIILNNYKYHSHIKARMVV